MKIKIFNGKRIKIRRLSKKDLRNVKKFQDFINSLIEEDVQISRNSRVTLNGERKWMEDALRRIREHKLVLLVADSDNLVGTSEISLGKDRNSHVAGLGIIIRKGYRGIGLGKYLMGEIIKLAKKELKPKPKILRLSVFPDNKPAIALYKKFGFKRVARIPKQFEYKGRLMDEIVMIREL
jgi:ribosomal protein S18 acetylase RimI-like enzyme